MLDPGWALAAADQLPLPSRTNPEVNGCWARTVAKLRKCPFLIFKECLQYTFSLLFYPLNWGRGTAVYYLIKTEYFHNPWGSFLIQGHNTTNKLSWNPLYYFPVLWYNRNKNVNRVINFHWNRKGPLIQYKSVFTA